MPTCAACGDEFPGRSVARYCSNACRQWAYRKRNGPDVTVDRAYIAAMAKHADDLVGRVLLMGFDAPPPPDVRRAVVDDLVDFLPDVARVLRTRIDDEQPSESVVPTVPAE